MWRRSCTWNSGQVFCPRAHVNSTSKQVLRCYLELSASYIHVYSCINHKHFETGTITFHFYGLWQALLPAVSSCQHLTAFLASALHKPQDFRPSVLTLVLWAGRARWPLRSPRAQVRAQQASGAVTAPACPWGRWARRQQLLPEASPRRAVQTWGAPSVTSSGRWCRTHVTQSTEIVLALGLIIHLSLSIFLTRSLSARCRVN